MINSKSDLIKVLKENNIFPKKRYGQNFLIDNNIISKIINNINPENKKIIEIGPGLGALTFPLAQQAEKIVAYDIDTDMIDILNKLNTYENLEIINKDFLEIDLDKLTEKYTIVSNLPYYITTNIVFKLINSNSNFNEIIIMVQKEYGDRIVAKPNTSKYSKLSATINLFYEVENVSNASRKLFYPEPNVDSVVLKLVPKKDAKEYYKNVMSLIKSSFKMRRKTLHNNLKNEYDSEKIFQTLQELKLKDNCRAQELDYKTFIELYKHLNK
ncbi:MAG: 16S rRNA (adenine(1518)-N(6)/adenine(1519)-N(6))-dimethyltransferase RsmA [Mycoplasma sp.]|nr:16S rRNA (adenine(1518)-N(6)/adenine(1519)-N(6))-dimethyltransferase RsmA [Mycoplasma sp.]